MRTGELIRALRRDGFRVTPGYLDFLFREGHLSRPAKEGSFLNWRPADAARLRSLLARRGRAPDGAAGGDPNG